MKSPRLHCIRRKALHVHAFSNLGLTRIQCRKVAYFEYQRKTQRDTEPSKEDYPILLKQMKKAQNKALNPFYGLLNIK